MTTIRYSCEVFKCSPLAKFSYFLALISVCAVGLVGCGSDEPAVATAEAPEDWKSLDWSPLAEEIESRALREGSGSNPVGRRFQKLGPEDTGIEFHNQLDRENIKNYLLSGAGLAVGDVDGNGLPDLFLVSQDGANKLFKQVAPWRFEDASEAAGIVDTKSWGSGAAFADFENDGDLDLYVCNQFLPRWARPRQDTPFYVLATPPKLC